MKPIFSSSKNLNNYLRIYLDMVIQGLIAILNESGELQMKKKMAAHSSVLA